MAKILKYLFIIISASYTYAQTTLIFLDSLTNQPIQAVVVKYKDKTLGISNFKGEFILKPYNYDTLQFNHIAYYDLNFSFSNKPHVKIKLFPKNYQTKEIVVKGKNNSSTSNLISLKLENEHKLFNTNVVELFKKQTSFFIKDYGQGMSVKTISSRGLSPENTVVLFNEARINDLRTGSFDFNSINMQSIDNIDIFSNSDNDNIHLSVGGIVKITTGNFNNNKIYFTSKITNDKMKSYIAGLSQNYGNFKFSINFDRAFSPNNYQYKFENSINTRKNAQFNKTFANLDLLYLSERYSIKLYAHYNYFNTGVPGAVVSNYDGDNNIKNITTGKVIINNNNFSLTENLNYFNTIAYNENTFVIKDPDKNLYYPYDQRKSTLREFQSTNRIQYKFNDFTFNFASFSMYSKLQDNSNMNLILKITPNFYRLLNKLSFSVNYQYNDELLIFKNPIVNYGLYYTTIKENLQQIQYDNFSSYKVGILLPLKMINGLNFKSNYLHDVREPSYSERFYSTLDRFSNNNLKNEDYHSIDFGFEYKNDVFIPLSFSLTYFDIKASNKIVWVPIARLPGLQIPVNEGKINSNGFEINGNINITPIYSTFNFNYTYNKSINKNKFSENDNSYNKLLVYSPVNRYNVNYSFEYGNISSCIGYSFVGKRYYTTDNTPLNKLPKYSVLDASFSYKFYINRIKINTGVTIMNFFNEKYFVIQSYPMPLRTYLLFINLEV
ncbi:MAG TPA: TonB-dependent receptor [Ignavibacteriales bacterium]|nr:TonB-dependent receptor [Ignavibacteriales bacterium]HOM65323.1 TonB-dependent receptor [Ignavibacteriales bacterium]HPP34563.1 TonB-dependent receptor [Ignavibacteriales bacterium]HRT99183.1 TonB-dependent receptor [Ignavibacteriales bacterium]